MQCWTLASNQSFVLRQPSSRDINREANNTEHLATVNVAGGNSFLLIASGSETTETIYQAAIRTSSWAEQHQDCSLK